MPPAMTFITSRLGSQQSIISERAILRPSDLAGAEACRTLYRFQGDGFVSQATTWWRTRLPQLTFSIARGMNEQLGKEGIQKSSQVQIFIF